MRLSDEKIKLIQVMYQKLGTYAATARAVGCAPSTVKKYCTLEAKDSAINANFNFDKEIPKWGSFDISLKDTHLTQLTEEEKEELRTMWKGESK